ncbi:MAG: O-antigen ligase family protein [Gallionella sp.]|nr:O-antigen ligase family protein [Gallionella sp.]
MIKIELPFSGRVETVAAFLLLVYPTLMFAVKGGMNGAFLCLFLLSVYFLASRSRDMSERSRTPMLYPVAMAAMPVAIFLSQSYHQHYSGHPYDAASRFLLAVPVFMWLRRAPFSVVSMVQYSFPLAAITGWLMSRHLEQGRFGIPTMDLIHFGDFELILGMLSLFSLNWTGRDALLLRGLKIAGFLAGVYASVASGSRGGWIALPVFLLIFLYFRFGRVSLKTILALPFVLVIAGFLAFVSSQEIHHRVDEVVSEVTAFQHGNPDTSSGVRLQLFKAAAVIFVQNPLFGVGSEGFALEMEPLEKRGKITHMAAELGKGEVHNELLSKAAALGVFGLIAMLMTYLVPLRLFYRAMKSDCVQVRHAGMLGLVFVSGFMVFGLTVEVLNLTMAAAFYGLTVAVLLAACHNIHHGEQIIVRNFA